MTRRHYNNYAGAYTICLDQNDIIRLYREPGFDIRLSC